MDQVFQFIKRFERYSKNTDLLIAFALIGVLAVMIIPLPAFMLDLALTISITLSLLMFPLTKLSAFWMGSRASSCTAMWTTLMPSAEGERVSFVIGIWGLGCPAMVTMCVIALLWMSNTTTLPRAAQASPKSAK